MDKTGITCRSQPFYKSTRFYNALNKLVKYGIAKKLPGHREDEPTVYSLTFKGRLVAQFLETFLDEEDKKILKKAEEERSEIKRE